MSISKNDIKKIVSLHHKKGRDKHKLFICEGIRHLEQAQKFGIIPQIVYFTPENLNSRSKKLISHLVRQSVIPVEVTASNMEKISATETPQSILALFEITKKKPSELIAPDIRRILWCENIADPGNLGTLIRTALAFGYKTIVLSGSSADPYNPKVVRSSAGVIFGVDILKMSKTTDFSEFKEMGFKLIAADLKGLNEDCLLNNINKNSKLVLILGSEAYGLSKNTLDNSDFKIKINHSSDVESLNVAVAGAILMNRFSDLEEVNQ